MDTGIDGATLAAYQAVAEANARIAILRRVMMDSKDAVPVKIICQIFDWKVPEVKQKPKPSAQKICEMFRNGKKPSQIACTFGMPETEVRDILRRMNLIDQATSVEDWGNEQKEKRV